MTTVLSGQRRRPGADPPGSAGRSGQLTGLVILGQPLQFADWLAIIAIVTANAVSASTGGRQPATRIPPPDPSRTLPPRVADPGKAVAARGEAGGNSAWGAGSG